MQFATKPQRTQVLVWLIWAITCLVFIVMPEQRCVKSEITTDLPILAGVVTHDDRHSSPFPWQPKRRLRKWAWKRYQVLKRAHRRAVRVARLARLALTGALSMAQVVDWLTKSQLRRYLGALPVLYALLDILQVREVINRYCPTKADVDHGAVVMVLILNRLVAPRPLYQVADWLAQTVLVYTLGVPASKFNDDRLGRTLDAISLHSRDIWQAVVHQAFVRAEIDLSVIFYDLSAFIAHGEYTDSQYIDFGFAHNTPMDKRKFKTGLNVTADGNIPAEYELWSGRTADKATVQKNMERMYALLKRHNWPIEEVLIIGDRANLNDELAFAYDDHNLHYLAGIQVQKKNHRELLISTPEKQFYTYPLTDDDGPDGYWGKPCLVSFTHAERQVTHRGLVVLSGPMRTALRQTRATQLRALHQELEEVQAKIGHPYYRTVAAVQKRASTRRKKSSVGKFMRAKAFTDEQGQVCLRWWIDRHTLWEAMQRDGRYLLVTNDWSLSPRRMLALYREKDGVEKRFTVSKGDIKVSPIYLHKDQRIEAMLLLNMLALLTYSLLERQVRQNGLQLTTRRIIEKLETLSITETLCWDSSRLYRVVPVDEEQAILLECLAQILAALRLSPEHPLQLSTGRVLRLALPPPEKLPLIA